MSWEAMQRNIPLSQLLRLGRYELLEEACDEKRGVPVTPRRFVDVRRCLNLFETALDIIQLEQQRPFFLRHSLQLVLLEDQLRNRVASWEVGIRPPTPPIWFTGIAFLVV